MCFFVFDTKSVTMQKGQYEPEREFRETEIQVQVIAKIKQSVRLQVNCMFSIPKAKDQTIFVLQHFFVETHVFLSYKTTIYIRLNERQHHFLIAMHLIENRKIIHSCQNVMKMEIGAGFVVRDISSANK